MLYEESGTIQLTPTANPAVFDANATSTYTAPNGDELHAVFTGQLNFETGVVTATVTYVGGTGRFANATGTATLSGQLLPGGSLDVAVRGPSTTSDDAAMLTPNQTSPAVGAAGLVC